jgi:hypothetical protein
MTGGTRNGLRQALDQTAVREVEPYVPIKQRNPPRGLAPLPRHGKRAAA